MSESEELTVDDGPSAFQIHRQNSYKKREVYEKLVAAKKIPSVDGASSSSSIMAQSADNPGPSSLPTHFVSRPSRQSAAKRESNSATLTINGPPITMTSSLRPNLPDCKPHPVIFGENIFIECSLLKSNLLMLKEALSNPNLAAVDLQTLTNDVRKAKEVLVEQVSLPLNDIQRELQEQISQEQQQQHHSSLFHPTNPVPVYALHELRTNLPLTPTASHPYPSHLYLYPVTEQLTDSRRNPLGINTDQSCVPYNAQSAH